MPCKRKLSCAYKATIILCCLSGIIINLVKTRSVVGMLSFFTMQSNILVLIFYMISTLIIWLKPDLENTKTYHFFKGLILMSILLTFSVYIVSLVPLDFVMIECDTIEKVLEISNMLVHIVTPMLVLFDYLLFDIKGFWRKKYIPLWCIFPILYLIYVYVYTFLGGKFLSRAGSDKYAYFFLDVEKLGVIGVAKYVLMIAAVYMLMCLLFIIFDNIFKKKD